MFSSVFLTIKLHRATSPTQGNPVFSCACVYVTSIAMCRYSSQRVLLLIREVIEYISDMENRKIRHKSRTLEAEEREGDG